MEYRSIIKAPTALGHILFESAPEQLFKEVNIFGF